MSRQRISTDAIYGFTRDTCMHTTKYVEIQKYLVNTEEYL